jgi:hypothetical protein
MVSTISLEGNVEPPWDWRLKKVVNRAIRKLCSVYKSRLISNNVGDKNGTDVFR